jgi:tRNA pseudouridine55 synthase
MDGILIIDKPQGVTSHDVVDLVRKLTGDRRAGHFGTLDPLATGVLPVAIGRATRLQQFYVDSTKIYSGSIRFGFSTDTYDSDGKPTSEIIPVRLALSNLEMARRQFLGKIEQTPPPFSAKKVRGVPAHRLARKNRPVHLRPVPIEIFRFDLNQKSGEEADFEIECSAGSYIRSIAHDMGQALGCGAHLTSLRRLASGEFTLTRSIRLQEFLQNNEPVISLQEWKKHVIPMWQLLAWIPLILLQDDELKRIKNGASICVDSLRAVPGSREEEGNRRGSWIRLFDGPCDVVGLGTITNQETGAKEIEIKPRIILV